jgi:hypothetical protein
MTLHGVSLSSRNFWYEIISMTPTEAGVLGPGIAATARVTRSASRESNFKGENAMKFVSRLAAFICLTSALGFSATWSGWLVDSKCYANLESNKSPTDTLNYVDRNKNEELLYCTPKAKTKSFALVDRNGLSYNLNAAGNAKAADLIRTAGAKANGEVKIVGEATGNAIKVDSISLAK